MLYLGQTQHRLIKYRILETVQCLCFLRGEKLMLNHIEECPKCGLYTFVEMRLVKDPTLRDGLSVSPNSLKYKNGGIVPESVAVTLISHFVNLGMQHLLATATHFKHCDNCGYFSRLG